jgi:prevent-host-death family protein
MRTVGSRELKNRLGRYLGLVKKGETIVVTDRGKPVARILPTGSEQEEAGGLEKVLQRQEDEGHLRRGTQPFKRFRPIRVKGKPLSEMILEERD